MGKTELHGLISIQNGSELRSDSQREFYVDTTGSDTTGDGTIGLPYLTITKAYEQLPDILDDSYIIKIANGSYTDFPSLVAKDCTANGQLVFDGYESVVVVDAGPYTVDSLTVQSDYSNLVNITTTPWTVDEFYGKSIRFTSGVATGYIVPIFSNTSGSIAALKAEGSLAGDTFEIVESGVNILVGHDVAWKVSAPQDTYSHAGAFNIALDLSSGGKLTLSSSTILLFPACSFINSVTSSYIRGAGIGCVYALDPDAYTLVSEMVTPIWGDNRYFYYTSGCQFIVDKTTPPGGGDYSIDLTTGAIGFWTTYLQNVFTRGSVDVTSCRCMLDACYVGGIRAIRGSYVLLRSTTIHSLRSFSLQVERNSAAWIYSGNYISIATTDFLSIIKNSSVEITADVTGVPATRYGIYVGSFSKVELGVTPTLTGGTNDVYFVRGATAAAFPTAGNAKTDGQGAYVVR